MADIGPVLSKIRALGADLVLDNGAVKIIEGAKLNDKQQVWIANNRGGIEAYLRSLKAALPISENDTPPQTWGQFARVLYGCCPEGHDKCDWSYFVTEMGKVAREQFGVEA